MEHDSRVRQLINQYIDPEESDEVHTTAFDGVCSYIGVGETMSAVLTIQDLIGALEVQLTSTDDKERNRATLLLAELLHRKQTAPLEAAVVHLLVVFFCHRLSDYPSVIPSLHALVALVKYHGQNLDPKYYDVVDIFQTIFRELNVSSLAQTIRGKVFELFDCLLSSPAFITSVTTERAATEILDGLINCIEGEKDPRCLLAAMRVLAKATHIEIISNCMSTAENSAVVEKLFDYTACYFPITFSPPADDPFGITSDMLVSSLEELLCSHAALHKHTLSFFVDHLTDDLSAGKVQAIRCLVRVCNTFTPTVFRVVYPDTGTTMLAAMCERMYACATDSASAGSNTEEGEGGGGVVQTPGQQQHDPAVTKHALWGIIAICAEIGRWVSFLLLFLLAA
jgi:DNA repair/transcription protein MET18/MMS19